MPTLFGDLETYSEADLKQTGAYRYAEDPTTEVMLFGYAIDDAPCGVWDLMRGEPMPADLRDALRDSDATLVFHNVNFDRTVLRLAWGWGLPIERFHDTMIQAYAHGLPGKLEQLCTVFGLDDETAKLADGQRLIHKFCKPAPPNRKVRRYTPDTDPEDWERFREYGWRDVEAMRALYHRMPTWNYPDNETERRTWHLDQTINDRGIYADLELAQAAIDATEREQRRLADRTDELTEGEVQSATQRDKLLAHIRDAYGVELPNAQKATLQDALSAEGLPEPVRELIRVRLQAGRSSTSKYSAMLRRASSDSRLRGMLQFLGAMRTGRWASRGINLQNLPRPGLDQWEIEVGIDAMLNEAEGLLYDDVMELAASAVRSALAAPPGHKLVVSDLSNIEGRMLAWLAGETDKLRRFREFDADGGHDIYKITAGQILGKNPADISKTERLVLGKVPELALGYQGGVGAFQSMAAVYGTDMAEHWPTLQETLPAEAREKAAENWRRWGKAQAAKAGQDVEDSQVEARWLAAEAVKISWRDRHPEIRAWWYELEDAAKQAVRTPGRVVRCRRVTLHRRGQYLRIKLPSGRLLVYPQPRIRLERADMGDELTCQTCGGGGTSPVNADNECPDCAGQGVAKYKEQLSFMGVDTQSGKWLRIKTYGGSLAENITQAASRDVLRDGMLRAEEAGWKTVLTVHDEVVTEEPADSDRGEPELSALLATVPDWAEGLDLAAEGYESGRFKKD